MIITPEIPQDKALPQLSRALDTAVMQAVFQQTIFGEMREGTITSDNRFQIRNCWIERVKYKRGQNCLICYRLEIQDTLTQTIHEHIVCGRIYPPGEALSRLAKAQSQPLSQPKFGRPLLHVPALEMVVWAFPNDRKLDGLPRLMDLDYLKGQLLPEVVAANFGPGWHIAGISQQLVHYAPEHTCTIRVQLQLQQRPTSAEKSLVLYGKTYYNQDGLETERLMRQLWASEARQQGRLHLAQPLGYQPHLKTLWQLGLPGQTLLEQELSSPRFLSLLGRAANTLAALHQAPVSYARSSPLSEGVARLQEMKQLLPQIRPACRERLASLVERLAGQAKQLEPQPVATLHGDLHLKNFLVEGEQVALIDLDNLCLGSPWQDVGSFIAGLLYLGLLMAVPEPVIRQLIDGFCHEYKQNVPWPMASLTLNWHIAAALINERAFRCLTRLKTGRLELVDDLIALADRISLIEATPTSPAQREVIVNARI
jgi:hypothetical protein